MVIATPPLDLLGPLVLRRCPREISCLMPQLLPSSGRSELLTVHVSDRRLRNPKALVFRRWSVDTKIWMIGCY